METKFPRSSDKLFPVHLSRDKTCRILGNTVAVAAMAPRVIHFIRHSEGYHNLEHNENLPDPDLTPNGKEQCEQLAKTFPYFDTLDMVCASPIRRAIQTALISMRPFLRNGEKKILALPLAQEASSKPANTPSDIFKLKEEYGDVVDFHRCLESGLTDYDSKRGRWASDLMHLTIRARDLRLYLRSLDEDEIAIISHGAFLHYVSGDVDEDGKQLHGWWQNTEYRTYRFWPVEHDDALLQETEESVQRRNASGPGMPMDSAKENELNDKEGIQAGTII